LETWAKLRYIDYFKKKYAVLITHCSSIFRTETVLTHCHFTILCVYRKHIAKIIHDARYQLNDWMAHICHFGFVDTKNIEEVRKIDQIWYTIPLTGLEMLMLVSVVTSINSNIIQKESKDLILIIGEDEL
jgi:hypothetical protein